MVIAEPQPKPDHELVEELARAKAEVDEAKEKYDRLCIEARDRILEKPDRLKILGIAYEAKLEEVWKDGIRYDLTRLVQFREKTDSNGELLYGEAWIPDEPIVIPGHWNIIQLKKLAREHGDLSEVEAAKLVPGYRAKLVVRK
tara:strand:+ start:257 stop:685 length:429 start_codon:yes stop_codon:yes gene_type:complete